MQAPAPRFSAPPAWLGVPLLLALLVALGAVSLLWNLLALPLLLLPGRWGQPVGRWVIARVYASTFGAFHRLGMLHCDSSELHALRGERGVLIVANHPSLLDAMLLVSRLPASGCVMKADVMRNPLLSAGARLAGYIPNDKAHTMFRRAVRELRGGTSVVMFPEGTRTRGPGLGPFHPSFALIAHKAKAPIQAVFVETSSAYLGKGWPIWKLPPLPVCYRLRLGERFEPVGDPHALAAQVQQHLEQGLEATAVGAAARPQPAAPVQAAVAPPSAGRQEHAWPSLNAAVGRAKPR